jgi:DNA-binding NarL/FixJ family response regulator
MQRNGSGVDMPLKHRVLIVEDDAEILLKLRDTINAHVSFEVVSAVTHFAQGQRALAELQPDILLTDLGLPDGSGLDIIKSIRSLRLDCEALVVSGFQDERLVFQALEAGAKGYILKHDENQKITDAMLTMLKGGAPISPVIARLMLQKFQTSPVEATLPEALSQGLVEVLTERQINILKLVSQGFSSKEIAEKLEITYYTVTTHIKNIYHKLQVNSRTEALHEALKLGLLS